jgi:cytochrome c biogenesis protein CcmG, thiol:disulfide interchange protein DsbE
VQLLLKQNPERLLWICHPGGMRRLLWIAAAIALVAVVVIGLTQAGSKAPSEGAAAKPFDAARAQRKLSAAPGALGKLYAQSNQLVSGGKPAFEQRLRALRGTPVVINKWASWCRPCRAEFPIFERVATARGSSVAFIGLNGKDKAPAAKKFLAAEPLPYPSYEDPNEDIARALEAPSYYPTTVFLDKRGKMAFIHTGEYASEAQLTADIKRYLG